MASCCRQRYGLVLLLMLSLLVSLTQAQSAVPEKILKAKTIAVTVFPQNLSEPFASEYRREVEDSLRKWGRFQVLDDPGKADLVAVLRFDSVGQDVPTFWSSFERGQAEMNQYTVCWGSVQTTGNTTTSSTKCQPPPQIPDLTYKTKWTLIGGILILDHPLPSHGWISPSDINPLWVQVERGKSKKYPVVEASRAFAQIVEESEHESNRVSGAPASSPAQARTGYVNCKGSDGLEVYAAPGKHRLFPNVPCGEKVLIIGQNGWWFRVRSSGLSDGYVSGVFISEEHSK